MNQYTDVSPEEAAAELLRRRRGREHLIDFTEYTLPKYYADPFHFKVANALERVEQGLCKRLMIYAPPRHGKALNSATIVPTPQGWTTHGELKVGDVVFHPTGKPVRVIGVSDQYPTDIRVELTNGEVVYCHENHEWTVFDRTDGKRDWFTYETNHFMRTTQFGKPVDLFGQGRATYQLPVTRLAEKRRIGIKSVTRDPRGYVGHCIQVDSEDGLYLVGKTMVATHNSELSTRRFPAWYMARNPEKNIISASYNADFATTFGRDVRGIVRSQQFQTLFPNVQIRSDNRAADEWELESGGKYFAVGVGTGTTGKGAHCLTASSLVTTSIGDVCIADLAHLRNYVKILGYDHYINDFVWKDCPAFADRQADGIYRVTTGSGRVVEATSEHPFFANGRYVEAHLLAPGDRLLLAVRSGQGEDCIRISEVGKDAVHGALLQQVLLVEGCEHSKAYQAEGIEDSEEDSDSAQNLRVLQSGVQAAPQETAGAVLLQGMQGSDACPGDDGREQSGLAQWDESIAATATCCSGVSQDQTKDSGARQCSVCGVQLPGRSGVSPHQYEPIGQQVLEPGDAVREMPHRVACGGTFEAVEDTVALVEFVREPTTVYNITVDGTENFFANGVLTHNCFLIDDPIKDRKEVKSANFRNDQWDWYRDVVYTRLEEDAAIVLTLTRWHYDDIAGRLIEMMNDGKGLPWEILTLPAIPEVKWAEREDGTKEMILNEDGSVPGDPLGRKPKEPLAPNRFSYAALMDRAEVLGERSFSALYQQCPMADDGGMFKSEWFEVPTELPARRVRVRAWDLAASADGDWTVGVLMSKDANGVFYIENVIRFRGTPLEVEKRIFETARSDGRSVTIVLPQDPGQAGKSQAQSFIRRLAGYIVKAHRPTGSKETRAAAFAAQAEGRNVKMVKGSWNDCLTDELETFPLGVHDDQVDAASDAFNELLGPRKAMVLDW